MPIDNCEFSFEQLTNQVLPDYLDELRQSIALPLSASELTNPTAARKAAGLQTDISGCYVFFNKGTAIYVGISRKIFKRLHQHLNIPTHNAASLAYRMACVEYEHTMRRKEAMQEELFKQQFHQAQRNLRLMQVAYVKIDNPLELYLFEAYAAIELNTEKWNTFKTH